MLLTTMLRNLYSNFREDKTKVVVYMSGANTEKPEWFSLDYLHSKERSLVFQESGGFQVRDIDAFKKDINRISEKGWDIVFAKKIPEDLSPTNKKYSKLENLKGKKFFNFQPLAGKDIEYLLHDNP